MATILVVDDEGSIRSLLALILKSEGHEVLTASNGLEGTALFRSFRSSIDLVITDMVMPNMDGYELVRLIQHDQPDARIICMSGYSDEGCPPGASWLAKPFAPKRVVDMVNEALLRDSRPAR